MTLMKNSCQEEEAYQLRGMAVDPDFQNQGIGAKLLQFIEKNILLRDPVKVRWCHARIKAVPFYERNGWVRISEIMTIEGVGDHLKMIRRF
jgi:GNAT superfamily N-acetyltransferase